VFKGRQRKSMEKWEIRLSLPQKPLNRSSPKFAWVITSGTPILIQNFITIRLPSYQPNMLRCASSDSASYFCFFPAPTAKTPAPIFTINTSYDVVSRKDVPFGVKKNKILHPIFQPKRNFFSPIFDGTVGNFASKRP